MAVFMHRDIADVSQPFAMALTSKKTRADFGARLEWLISQLFRINDSNHSLLI